MNIDGGSDIGADLTTSDLIIVDDGAGGTNKKAALSRVVTMPDQPEHGMKGANVATNVYHALGSYKRFPSLVSYTGTSTVGKDAHGSGSFRDNSNVVYNFAATKTDIYQLASGAFTSRKGSLTNPRLFR